MRRCRQTVSSRADPDTLTAEQRLASLIEARAQAEVEMLRRMMEEGSLAPIFGWLIGVGPGEGISLLFFVMGLIGTVFGLGAYTFKQVRNVEELLPDHDSTGTAYPVAVTE